MNNIKIEYNQYTEIDCSKIKGFEIDNSMAKDIIHISMYTFYFGLNAVTFTFIYVCLRLLLQLLRDVFDQCIIEHQKKLKSPIERMSYYSISCYYVPMRVKNR